MHDIIAHVSLESPNQPEVASLIEQLDAYQKPLYAAESFHGIAIDALSDENVLLLSRARQTGKLSLAVQLCSSSTTAK